MINLIFTFLLSLLCFIYFVITNDFTIGVYAIIATIFYQGEIIKRQIKRIKKEG